MKDEIAIEITKIQILVIGGTATALEIGFNPNIYLFGVGMSIMISGLFINLLSLVETHRDAAPILRNSSLYLTIGGIYNFVMAFGVPLGTDGPKNIVDGLVFVSIPTLIAIMILFMKGSIYKIGNSSDEEPKLDRESNPGFVNTVEYSLLLGCTLITSFLVGLLYLISS